VAIVTNGGGPGILCADACEAAGLKVAELSADVRAELDSFLSPQASTADPIDMIATAPAEHYRRTIEVLVQSGECDMVIALFVPPLMTAADDVAREIDAATAKAEGVTIASVFMDHHDPPREAERHACAARFAFPEDAVRAMAHAAKWSAWRRRPPGEVPQFDGCHREQAAVIIARAVARGETWLRADDVIGLLGCYGLPIVQTRVAKNTREAVSAAKAVGGPVALKAIAPGLIHKTDAGSVRLDLDGADQVRAAVKEIQAAVRRAGHHLQGFSVQPMVPEGVELLLGVVHDASFGPVLVCGAGGTSAELIRDVSVRIAPLTDLDADEMLRSLRTYPLLTGYRGRPDCDVEAVKDVLLRLSALVEAHPEVAELDANPLIASPDGAVIVDARVRVQRVEPEAPLGSLRRP
jgi:acyl-CoA synthetase (NDP forming)